MTRITTNKLAYELVSTFLGIVFMICALHTVLVLVLLVDSESIVTDNKQVLYQPLPKLKLDSQGVHEESPSLIQPCHNAVQDVIHPTKKVINKTKVRKNDSGVSSGSFAGSFEDTKKGGCEKVKDSRKDYVLRQTERL